MKKYLLMALCVLMMVVIVGIITGSEINANVVKVGVPAGLLLSLLTVTPYQASANTGYRDSQKTLFKITASFTLTEKYLGALISNEGASGAVTYKLPEATHGKSYCFSRMADHAVNIDPQDDEYMIDPTTGAALAVGEVFSLDHLYDYVEYRCMTTGYWTPMAYNSPVENRVGSIWVATSIEAQTDDYQILSTDDGKCFTNTEAAKNIVLTLPEGVEGMVYEAAVTESGFAITIDAYAGEFIKNPVTGGWMSASKYLKADRLGSHIRLVCLVDTYWFIEIMEGQWLPEETYAVTKIANYSVLAADNGASFNNTGDTGAIIFTLPTGVPGMRYTFEVTAAYDFSIDTPGTDYIQDPVTGAWQAVGKYIRSSVIGSRITVVCDIALYWHLENIIGPWIGESSILVAKTTDYAVETTDSGKTFTNAAAGGAVIFTLPAAVVGLRYQFFVQAAQDLVIDPDGTETLACTTTGVQGAAGKKLTANAAGEYCNLICLVAGKWEVRGYIGTWSVEG